MPPSQHVLHGSGTIDCTTLDGKPCTLCEQYRNFEPELIRAEALVREAQGKLAEVQERRRLFRTNVNNKYDQLAGRLPAEIVAEIFKATLTRRLMPGLEDHVIDSPLALGAVCQTWRKIAWSTPSLWNWIHIFLQRPESKYLEETVKEWLGRSGNLPLTIQITCGRGVADVMDQDPELFFPESGIFGDFVSHVNDCSVRWENVSFMGPSSTTDFLVGSAEGTPKLKVLRINTTDGPHHHFGLQTLSKPHSLAMGEPSNAAVWNTMNIVWDSLVDIHFEKFTAKLCIQAIKQMPRLTNCVLIIDSDNFDLYRVPTKRFVHSNLERFQLYVTNAIGLVPHSVFDHFTFPSLTHLHIFCDGDPQGVVYHSNGQLLTAHSFWEESLKAFILVSSSELLSLELQLPWKLESLLEVLDSTKSLSRLVLKDPSPVGRFDFHAFLDHLANSPPNDPDHDDLSTPSFLPNLQSLSILGRIENKPKRSAFRAILDACGRPSDLRDPCRRPLAAMVVTPRNLPELHPSKKELRRASALDDAGFILSITDPVTGEDFLES